MSDLKGKILRLKPDWYESFDNRPSFCALLSADVPFEEYRHEEDGQGHYRAQVGDSVHYFYSNGKPSQGYGGRLIKLTLLDGSVREFQGGWSSNSAAINASWPENPCVECSITDDPEVFRRGHTYCSGAINVTGLLDWWFAHQHNLDWGIAICQRGEYEGWVEPTKGRFVKLSHHEELKVVCRLLPVKKIYGERADYEARFKDYFWKSWYKVAPRGVIGELSSDQMAVVRS